ncbi:MAG TPA: hypothetical protein VGO61_06700 [Steroidobacteraceae bacterium]|jgi:hypothetical protein|nr:hypothetical protein [Steroidobacteraceae bacterium]
MPGLVRILGVVLASMLAFALVVAIVNRTTGNGDLAGLLGVALGFLLTPAVLLHFWKPADPGRQCPEGHGLYPECLYVVNITEESIEVKLPDGQTERVRFDDLDEVRVETDDSGPWGADVWWVFLVKPEHVATRFPNGATGVSQAVARLQQLPGFDNERFAQAMGCTSVAQFSCWKAGRQHGTLSS